MTDRLVDRREPGFYIVDNEIIEDFGAKLGVYGIAVYNVLLKFSNASGENAFPSYQTIADLLGISRPKAIEGVKLLLECGLIEKTARKSSSGDPTTNIYTLLDVKKTKGGGKQNLLPSKQGLLGGGKQGLLGGKQGLPDQDPLINTQSDQYPIEEKEEAAPLKPSAHPAVQAFRELQSRYPNKLQMDMIVQANPDLTNWIRAVKTWIGRGNKPTNVEGMLDWAMNPSLMERFSGSNTNNMTIRNGKGVEDGQVGENTGYNSEEIAAVRAARRNGDKVEVERILRAANARIDAETNVRNVR